MELPSCSCCGIHTYPVNGGTERPLTQPSPQRQSETDRAKQSFVVLPISDPRFDRLKVTYDQLADHRATRKFRTVLQHRGADYHLYPNLVLPTAPGTVPGPDSEPHVVVCSACFARLPRPKATSAVSCSGAHPPAETNMDSSSDSDSSMPRSRRTTLVMAAPHPSPCPYPTIQ